MKTKNLLALATLALLPILPSEATAFVHQFCNGNPLKWPTNTMTFNLDGWAFPYVGDPSTDAILSAMDAWNTSRSNFTFLAVPGVIPEPGENPKKDNGISEIWFSDDPQEIMEGARAVTAIFPNPPGADCRIEEADIIFRNTTPHGWDPGVDARLQWPYGDEDDFISFRAVAVHELGHALGLKHEPHIYNVMGDPLTHVHRNGDVVTAYAGTDAVAGAIALYGAKFNHLPDLRGGRPDIAVAHWRWVGSEPSAGGEVSQHDFTRVFVRRCQTCRPETTESTSDHFEPIYEVLSGMTIGVEFTYENYGPGRLTFNVGFYLSPDKLITAEDRRLGGTTITLNANTPSMDHTASPNNTQIHWVTLPCSLTSGRYYVGAIVDDIAHIPEAREDNNATYLGLQVSQVGLPCRDVTTEFRPWSP